MLTTAGERVQLALAFALLTACAANLLLAYILALAAENMSAGRLALLVALRLWHGRYSPEGELGPGSSWDIPLPEGSRGIQTNPAATAMRITSVIFYVCGNAFWPDRSSRRSWSTVRVAYWPMGCHADEPDERGNVDEGFDPLHAGQTAD